MSLRDLEKRLEKEPDNLPLRVTVAGMLAEAGRRKDAVEHYRKVALAYRAQGRLQQAIAVCRSILELAPDDLASATLLAELTAPAERPSGIEPTATGVRNTPEPELPVVTPSPRVRPASDTVKPPSVPSLAEPASEVAATSPRPAANATSRAALIPVVRTLNSRPPTPPPVASPLSTAKRMPPPPPPARAKPPTEAPDPRLTPPTDPSSAPPRRSSFETETPLPQPVPYHIADPTSSQNKLERESADDVTRIDDGKRSPPRESDTSGLREAARHISGLFSPNRAKPPTDAPIFDRSKRPTNTPAPLPVRPPPPVEEPARATIPALPRPVPTSTTIRGVDPARPSFGGPSFGGPSAAGSAAPSGRGRGGDRSDLGPSFGGPSAAGSAAPSGRGRGGDRSDLGPSAAGSAAPLGRGRGGDPSDLRPSVVKIPPRVQRPPIDEPVAPLPPTPRVHQPTLVEELPPPPATPLRASSAHEDVAKELDTRQRRRLSAEELDKIASPPPTVPIEPVELDDELPTPLPTTPAARRATQQPPIRDTPYEPRTDVHTAVHEDGSGVVTTRDTQRQAAADAPTEEEQTAPRELPPEPLANAFFAALPQNRRDAALVRCIKRRVRAGQLVIRQGETSHPLYLVVAGQLELTVERANGSHAHLDTIDPGQYVGEASLLGRSPSPANLVAVSDSDLLALPPHSLFELAGAFPSLWAALKDSAEKRQRQYEKILRG